MTFPIVYKFDAKWVVIPYEWSDFESAEIDRLVAENGGPSLTAADAIGWCIYTSPQWRSQEEGIPGEAKI